MDMRLANLCDHGTTSINLGDYLQFLTINGLYEQLGIKKSQIYYLKSNEIASYRGEKLLLPLNFITTIFVHDNKVNVSNDIIPVFLSISLSNMKEKIDIDKLLSQKENYDFFLKYSPVGCRDEYTYRIFLKYNIPAYLNGCLTATLPKRKIETSQIKVFFADAPENLLPFIPKELFEDCEFISQQAQFTEEKVNDYEYIFKFVQERYERYRKEAKIVVTSRLHVAVPCTAMGIPVIFAKDYVDTRFSWLEKLIPLYSLGEYEKINWKPQAPDYEEKKKLLRQLAISRIKDTYEMYNLTHFVSQFYLERNAKENYYDSHDITHKNTMYLEKYVSKYWEKEDNIKFALWGINANAPFWINWICERYPNAKFVKAIDMYKTGEIHGIPIDLPGKINKDDRYYVIVIAVSAVPDALKLFKKLGWDSSKYCIAVDSFILENPEKR